MSVLPFSALQGPLAKEMSPLVAKTIGTQLFLALEFEMLFPVTKVYGSF